MFRVLQCNTNHSWPAQDLLAQCMIEKDIGVCAVAEPRHVPNSSFWFASKDGKAAWTWRPEDLSRTCALIAKGNCFVAIKYDNFHLISCYISPNVPLDEFLDELGDIVRITGKRTIICEDLNSKSVLWEFRYTDRRGSWKNGQLNVSCVSKY